MKSIESRVKQIVSDRTGLEKSSIDNRASFIDDLDADSLDVMELIIDLEKEFAVRISDEEAAKIKTVQQAIDYIKAKVKFNARQLS